MRKFRIEDSPAVTVLLNEYLGDAPSSLSLHTIDNIIVTQGSLTWPQCTQTRTSNIGSCPRSQQIQIWIPFLKYQDDVVNDFDCLLDVILTRLTPGEHHRGLRCGEARQPWNYHRFCKVRKPSSPSTNPSSLPIKSMI